MWVTIRGCVCVWLFFLIYKHCSVIISNYLYIFVQTLLSVNNGVVDGPATDVQEHQLMSSGYQLLLQVLNATFTWWGGLSCQTVKWEKCFFGRISVAPIEIMCVYVCLIFRSGFSQPGQRSLLKKALGVLAGRLKEGGPELTLEQLVKWATMLKREGCNY